MTDPGAWQPVADRIERTLTDRMGGTPARASVSFLGVDPIEILRYHRADRLIYCSLGMARHPMASRAESVVDPAGPRAELLFEISDPADGPPGRTPANDPAQVWKALAIFAAAPAVEGVVYGPGMTVDSGRTVVPGSRCTGALVVESEFADIDSPVGLVSVLRLLPATADELAWARVHGVAGLRARYAEQRVDVLDLGRPPVSLN